MKKYFAILLIGALILVGCGNVSGSDTMNGGVSNSESEKTSDINQNDEASLPERIQNAKLGDSELLNYVEESIYVNLINDLGSEDYLIENISTVYISKEYIDELSYNSQSNVYFGYTLEEIENAFGDQKYVFSCNDDGETIVTEYVVYDDTFDQIIKNVAIGTGVILVCATVSIVSAGAGAPAVCMIFAMSAKTGAIAALSGAAISGTITAAVTGYQTRDWDETLKASALAASDGFKWGAITGAIAGGACEAWALKGMTMNGLSMNEAATIQQKSKYSADIIKQFHSVEEYQIYEKAGLYTKNINGNAALVRDIDLNYVSELADGTKVTNLERMKNGLAPLDPDTGLAYQLHHIGQKADGALAVLKQAEHQGNASILNIAGKSSEIDREAFSAVRSAFWKSYAAMF